MHSSPLRQLTFRPPHDPGSYSVTPPFPPHPNPFPCPSLSTTQVPVPRYIKEDRLDKITFRDKWLSGYMQLKHEVERMPLELQEPLDPPPPTLNVDDAIEVIQRNERGRQGQQKALRAKKTRDDEARRKQYRDDNEVLMDPDLAATRIQTLARKYTARVSTAKMREDEYVFLGMTSSGFASENDRQVRRGLRTTLVPCMLRDYQTPAK